MNALDLEFNTPYVVVENQGYLPVNSIVYRVADKFDDVLSVFFMREEEYNTFPKEHSELDIDNFIDDDDNEAFWDYLTTEAVRRIQ